MSQATKQQIKDWLSIVLSVITILSIVFYGGQFAEKVNQHEKRITDIEESIKYFQSK